MEPIKSDLKIISEWSFDDILKYIFYLVSQASVQGVMNYHYAVGHLESAMKYEIMMEKNNGGFDYYAEVEKKEKELQQKYKAYNLSEKETYLNELDKFKLSLLTLIMRKKMPEEIEIVLGEEKSEEDSDEQT